ncbi:hypothetical protein FACS189483_06390 [Spirochaetia bacterium]|nr:hypothetical protein FACS189483_06390 [Spirochaetia bacterium]
MGFNLFYKKGSSSIFLQRESPDKDYIWFLNGQMPSPSRSDDDKKWKAIISAGIGTNYFINNHFTIYSEFVYSHIMNPTYDPANNPTDDNVHISIGTKLYF